MLCLTLCHAVLYVVLLHRTPVDVKEWGGFSARLRHHLPLLDKLGYVYRPLDA